MSLYYMFYYSVENPDQHWSGVLYMASAKRFEKKKKHTSNKQ